MKGMNTDGSQDDLPDGEYKYMGNIKTPKTYILEASPDGIKWKLMARFREGDMSRFGKPFSPEIMLLEAKSFIDAWKPLHHGYGKDVMREISLKKHVRVIIEL